MSKTSHQITRKCIVCGQAKPLMAFLQKGGSYGSTCATCKTKQSGDDDGSTSKGLRVDDKARLLAEQEQKRLREEKKERVEETLEKREKIAKEKQKGKSIAELDKKQRDDYLNIKKTLLTTPSRKDETDTIKKSASDAAISTGQQQEHQTSQQKQVEHQVKQETTVDYASTFISSTKFTGPDQQKYLRWLGSSNPVTRAYEQAFGIKGSPEQSAKSTQQATPAQVSSEKKSGAEWLRTFEQVNRSTSQSSKTSEKNESSVGERVEEALGPSSQRKR